MHSSISASAIYAVLQHRVVAKLILVATRTGAALQHHFAGTALRYRGVGAALQLHVCSVGAALRWHNIAVVRCRSVACVPCGVTLFQHRFAAALPRRVGAVLQHRIAVSSISASGLSAASTQYHAGSALKCRIAVASRPLVRHWGIVLVKHCAGAAPDVVLAQHCSVAWMQPWGTALVRQRVGAVLQPHIGGTSLWHHICGTLCWWSIVLAQHCAASCLHNFT